MKNDMPKHQSLLSSGNTLEIAIINVGNSKEPTVITAIVHFFEYMNAKNDERKP